jgi:lactate racemase
LHPISSEPLNELVKGKNSVCIVVTDITRECPDNELLIPVLEILESELSKKNITILIANGMHRKMTYLEKVAKYGKNVVDNYKIIDHDSKNEKYLINLGKTKNETPIIISRIAFESELLISLGVVEPHQFAGYSGGYKTVAIGVAGDITISRTHSPKMLSNIKTGLTNLETNPISQDILEIGKKTGLNFVVNVILGYDKKILEVESGDPLKTHKSLIKIAKEIYETSVPKLFDAVICGVGYPKDTNLYQVSRAASYLYYSSSRVIKEGGYIIIPANCEEGAGRGIGEKRFFSLLKNKNLEDIIQNEENFKAGEQRAYLMANVLLHHKVIIVNSQNPEVISQAKMIPAKNMENAFKIMKRDLGENLDLLFIPNSLTTIPILNKK